MLKVFVYGTLKPGERNYPSYCAPSVVTIQLAVAYGKLYDLPLGYPAAIFPDSCLVSGYLLTFADVTVLEFLDELEDYSPSQPTTQNHYQRQPIEVYDLNFGSLGKVWTYAMNQQAIDAYGGIFISHGWWTGRKQAANDC